MGKKDLSLRSYLSDPVRYADVYNGSVFKGVQVLDGAQLEEAGTVISKAEGDVALERTCDIAMRQKAGGGLFALWILENQETVDYGMPVRVLLREALEYERQVKEIQRRNKQEKGSAGEYLYKVRKTDRLRPVSTLIIYWGSEPWDGPRSLHEILDFTGDDEGKEEELKKRIPDYPLHILDLSGTNDYSGFRTSLRTVFELYACRSNKKQLLDYVENHEECRHLDVETYEVIRQLIGSAKLRVLPEKSEKEDEEGQDMWKAIEDLIEDGRQEGRVEGRQEGQREGRQKGEASQMISIIDSMMENLHCTLEEACGIAGRTLEEYQQARALV